MFSLILQRNCRKRNIVTKVLYIRVSFVFVNEVKQTMLKAKQTITKRLKDNVEVYHLFDTVLRNTNYTR